MPLPTFERMLTPPAFAALFSERAIVQAMLDFEAALTAAQADVGLIPAPAATAIAAACDAGQHDVEDILSASARAGSLAIPLVKSVIRVVAETDPAAAGFVHWGSTSQDVIDTAMVLATRPALARIDASLHALVGALLDLAERDAATPVLARTLMQPAVVTSFGLKCVNWAAPLVRSRLRLRETAARALALQLGGAVGTLSAMGDAGPAVVARMAARLGLAAPEAPWHTQRDEWMRLAMEVAVTTGSLGKVATDLSLMAQGEVAELAEPSGAGRGGSSAMPHKRNPVSAMIALADAYRAPHAASAMLAAMGQQHERGMGNWQAELAEWPRLLAAADGAAAALAEAFGGLEVDRRRMRRNIDALHGLVFAENATMVIAKVTGKARAQALLETLSRQAASGAGPLAGLVERAVADDADLAAQVDTSALSRAFDPVTAAAPAAEQAQRRAASLRAAIASLPEAAWARLGEAPRATS